MDLLVKKKILKNFFNIYRLAKFDHFFFSVAIYLLAK